MLTLLELCEETPMTPPKQQDPKEQYPKPPFNEPAQTPPGSEKQMKTAARLRRKQRMSAAAGWKDAPQL